MTPSVLRSGNNLDTKRPNLRYPNLHEPHLLTHIFFVLLHLLRRFVSSAFFNEFHLEMKKKKGKKKKLNSGREFYARVKRAAYTQLYTAQN